ncbi:hypothetical protein SADUNF_Sadunf04G0052900 [Salix dunnii]|uniref:NB-ARC domain-containing protein n=1 Tax=Salix dunnii TaxID=1413687 RepID=A0A835N0E1_9ROSI|nr:hypothetical protein SADUNF_Sadunf04G0052900 [Salix dunnii]
MIKYATEERFNDLEEVELEAKLEAIFHGREYFLVLDDVWNEDSQKWLLLKPLLSKGALKSKIIVTTRSKRGAQIMGSSGAYEFSLLDQKDWLSLFYKFAFKERQKKRHPNLVEFGKEIVGKCKQIPSAVINLGTQLHDIDFSDAILVQFWMAQGLVHQSAHPSEKLEDIGICNVRELISKCFFQDVNDLPFCMILNHHWLKMNVQSYAQITTKFSKLPDTHQLLTLNSFFQALPKFPNEIERVRTLGFVNSLEEHRCRTDSRNICQNLSICGRWNLWMSNTKLKSFPKSIFKFQNFQALALGHGFEELSSDVKYLISLN